MKFEDIRWLFFDLGSTLIDESEAEKYRIERLHRSLGELGIGVPVGRIYELIDGASKEYAPSSFRTAVRRLCRNDDDYEYLSGKAGYSHRYEKLFGEVPGILEALAKTYRIGFIANQSPGAEKRLEQFGILGHFSLRLSSAETGMEKPDPGLFRLALEKAGCEARQAVMIGDRLDTDIYPAKRAGMRTVRILRGVSKTQAPLNEDYEADLTIENLNELLAVF